MKFTYTQFRVLIHIVVAFVFLADLLKPQLPIKIYIFLKENRDTLFGFYYIYLAYEIYSNIEIETPRSSFSE